MYQVGWSHYALAAGTVGILSLLLGVVGAVLVPPGRLGLFGLLIGLFAGSGIGSLFGAAILRVTGGKRGPGMQLIAAVGVVVLLAVRLTLGGEISLELVMRDLVGPLAGIIAVSVAWQRLR